MTRSILKCMLLFALIANSSCVRDTGFSKMHNLDFNLEEDYLRAWKTKYKVAMKFESDSAQLKNGKAPLKIMQVKVMDMPMPLMANLQQRFALPEIKADSVEISLTGKSQSLAKAGLTVTGIDRNEDVLYSKSLSCISEGEWATFSLSVPLKEVEFFHLELEATGSGNKKDEQYWWLDRMRITANGKNIDGLPVNSVPEMSVNTSDMVPLSFDRSQAYAAIPELAGKRILAIGESVHGSMQANQSAMQLIKYQVANNQCKLILMELPLATMLSFNRFIQGDEGFKLDSLMHDFQSIISASHFTGMLLWLKEYNRTAEEKVWLMGMDLDIRQMSSAMWLFDYLFTINQARPHPIFRELCARLVAPKASFSEISRLLDENKAIDSILSPKEYQILKYCFEMTGNAGSRTSSRKIIRDSLMHQNSEFLLNLLAPSPKKATIYAHLGHNNYKTQSTFYLRPSFGSYMKRKFGKDYSCIGILVGEGNVLVIEKDSLQEKQLQAPPANSIEYALYKGSEPYLYMPAPSGLAWARELGLGYTVDQFGAMFLQSRLDGIIFIRRSGAIERPAVTEVPAGNSTISYLRASPMRRFIRNIERNKVLQRSQNTAKPPGI